VDVHRETVIESADLSASQPPGVTRLVGLNKRLSSIAGDVGHLQGELARLQRESKAVVRLLEEREAELADAGASLSRLADECARAQERRAETQASLAKAKHLLAGSQERAASLERLLEEGKVELADTEASYSRLADECARAREERNEAQASLVKALGLLEAVCEQVASLGHELDALRARSSELETS
jgi:chromosome segregation ATPase